MFGLFICLCIVACIVFVYLDVTPDLTRTVKYVIQDIVSASAMIDTIRDPMEARHMLSVCVAKWEVLEKIAPVQVRPYYKIREVLYAQAENLGNLMREESE
jgi:hypothetical protein